MKRRVVVTGLGIITSLACEVDQFWQKLLAGESGIHELRCIDRIDRFKVRFGGDVWDWDAERYPGVFLDRKEIKRVDRFTQFAMVAAHQAMVDSGITPRDGDVSQELAAQQLAAAGINAERAGVILGSGIGGLHEIEDQVHRVMEKGVDRVSPFTVPKMMLNAAGGNISIRYGLKAANYSVATACASANNAIGDAIRTIQYGDADFMITGGTEAAITEMGLAGFQNMKALSTRNEAPTKASRPFSADRDGFVLSEGAGLVVLEEYESAKRRGARIYCEMLGSGFSADAGHITAPDEGGTGAGRAMSIALANAGLAPTDISYICAHGTSTPLGDQAETNAIKRVFGEHAYKTSVSSIKSHLGHTLGACGGIALVACVKAVQDQIVPPTINLETADPGCDLDFTPHEPRRRPIDYVISNSFGFGGHNATIALGRLKD